jgi:signal transduction histidine kinase/PAS domain-containing protein
VFPEIVSDFINQMVVVEPNIQHREQKFNSQTGVNRLILWMAGKDALYYHFNAAWLKFTGQNLTPDYFASVGAEEATKNWLANVHSDDRQTSEDALQKAFAKYESLQRFYRLYHFDGEYRRILDTAFPSFAADGCFVGYVGYILDISDVETQKFPTPENELKLQLSLNHFPFSLWNWEVPTGKMNWISVTDKLFGIHLEDLPATYESFINWIHPEDRHLAGEKMFTSLAEGTDCDFEVRILWEDSSQHWIKVQGQVIKDENGKNLAMTGTVLDITDSKTAIMELEIGNQDLKMIITKQAEEIESLRQQVQEEVTKQQCTDEALRKSENKFRAIAQREAILNRISKQIRSSLELDAVLETTVQEIHRFFEIDHCAFFWYRQNADLPDWEGVCEAKNSQLPSLMKVKITKEETSTLCNKIFNKEIIRIDSVESDPDLLAQQLFRELGLTALLSFPIHTQCGEIGALVCTYCGGLRPWLDSEVKLLQAVTDQLAIAIDQAKLYKQSQLAAQTAQEKAQQLEAALHELSSTQSQLIQNEKMSSLGQLVAGVAHEINNPVNFIYGNISHASDYIRDLLNLIALYQQHYNPPVPEISAEIEAIDLEFLSEDLPKILDSMNMGAERIRQIVLSLRNFSRIDEPTMKPIDLHEGIDSTLLLLQNRLKAKPGQPSISVIKEYSNLPPVCCYAAQLNQVFMNLLVNAIDALEESLITGEWSTAHSRKSDQPSIRIRTALEDNNQVIIGIADNGPGMSEETRNRLFDPFFTTKPIGKGTGMGLSISYQIIVEKHQGKLQCFSQPGEGAEFVITIPFRKEIN